MDGTGGGSDRTGQNKAEINPTKQTVDDPGHATVGELKAIKLRSIYRGCFQSNLDISFFSSTEYSADFKR